MRTALVALSLASTLALLPLGQMRSADDCQDLPNPPTKDLPAGLQFPDVSSVLPFDVTFGTVQSIENDQKAFDLFSWSSFVALNWPAGADGKPLQGKISDNPDALRVWETFIAARQVFKAGGAAPDPWGSNDTVVAARFPKVKAGQRVLVATTKAALAEFLQAGFGAARFPPIADTNGMYVFYEMRLNKVEYDYLVENKLYSKNGQDAFLQKPAAIDFPKGTTAGKKLGSLEIKSAWKQLGKGDDKSKFYTISAVRIDPVTQLPSPQSIPFGLVGLHIVTRTEKADRWIWSTFEHVDNAPDVGETALKPRYNFNDPTKFQPTQGFGFKPPVQPGHLPKHPQTHPTQTQITRVLNNNVLSSLWTKTLNQAMQGKLAGTVWANYRLVTTQWPGPNGQFIPCHVTNTVAETYIQNSDASGSCMRCHASAKTAGRSADGQRAPANFSYLLQMAQPVPAVPGP